MNILYDGVTYRRIRDVVGDLLAFYSLADALQELQKQFGIRRGLEQAKASFRGDLFDGFDVLGVHRK